MQPITAVGLKYDEVMLILFSNWGLGGPVHYGVGFIICTSFLMVESNLDLLKVKFFNFQLHVYNKDL